MSTMHEKAWQDCLLPSDLIEMLGDQATDRRLLLFGCACARNWWHLLKNDWGREAVRVAEQHAYGQVSDFEKTTVKMEAAAVARVAELKFRNTVSSHTISHGVGSLYVWNAEADLTAARLALQLLASSATADTMSEREIAVRISSLAADLFMSQNAYEHRDDDKEIHRLWRRGRKAVADTFRDIFQSPFSPFPESPEWRTPAVRDLATAAYQQCGEGKRLDRERLLVLSDALEEAGCTEADGDILKHLRTSSPLHYRECRVIDFLRNHDLPNRNLTPDRPKGRT